MRTFGDILKNNDYQNPAIVYVVKLDFDYYGYYNFLKNIKIFPQERYVREHRSTKSNETWISIDHIWMSALNTRYDLRITDVSLRGVENAKSLSHYEKGGLHIFADKESLDAWLNELQCGVMEKISELQNQIKVIEYVQENASVGIELKDTDEMRLFAKAANIKTMSSV